MPSPSSHVFIAAAGSGKTTRIVDEALQSTRPVLLTTYTEENVGQIRDCITRKCGHIPPHITVMSWYAFLLQDCVRPYQNQMNDRARVKSIDFSDSNKGKTRRKDEYLTKSGYIYKDKTAEFAYECNRKSGGLVARRLMKVYARIYVDEVQDIAGYDLNFIEELISAGMPVTMVGDPRQGTFSTNTSRKNTKFRRDKVYNWLKELELKGLVTLTEQNQSHRCNQVICDFADALYPELPKTVSSNTKITGHDGIFHLKIAEIQAYIETHQPMCLRYKKNSQTYGNSAFNIGAIKGREYDRVLVFPTAGMKKYLRTKDLADVGDRTKLYIAVTRARYSVAFVLE